MFVARHVCCANGCCCSSRHSILC